MTKIVMISDTHCQHGSIVIPKGDVIIHAGDMTGRGSLNTYVDFLDWYSALSHPFKILVAGNHDLGIERGNVDIRGMCKDRGIIYLQDEGYVICNKKDVIKIWGSPVSPQFGTGWAFNRTTSVQDSLSPYAMQRGWAFIGDHWDKIPDDIDILVTHGPPHGILDEVDNFISSGDSVGCQLLRKKVESINSIKVHVFGHIHEARGIHVDKSTDKIYVNASVLDGSYTPYQDKPFILDWSRAKKGKL